MNGTLGPGGLARRLLLRRALGAGIVVAIGSRVGGGGGCARSSSIISPSRRCH